MSEDNNQATETSISFKLSDDEAQLIAVIPAGTDIPPLNITQLNKFIIENGHTHWHLLDDGLAQACSLLGKSETATDVIIGDRLDGEFVIKISDDATQVYMTVTPPQGGKPVTLEQVQKYLADRDVTHGIKKDSIQQALSNNSTDKCLIAASTPPQQGEDATFESLIAAAKDTRPQINDDGSVDYHEIGSFITVNAGDQLMRKIPPTKGTHGADVYGKIIPAKPGKDIPYASRLTGVEIDKNDRGLLIASTGGQPEIVDNGMAVSPVLNLKDVDLSTGNIDFDGTVNIKGDVVEGMKIIASGDVIINGMMEGANIQADGNIIISKGVIGRGELRAENGEPGSGAAILKSGQSIEARFIENAIVHADENVTAGELVSHSEITALNQVLVGKKGAKKGHILGGTTKAVMAIEAQIFGSQSNVKTFIEVGNNPGLHEQSQKTDESYEEKLQEQQKLTTLIVRLKNQADPKSQSILERAASTLTKLNEDLATIQATKSQLEKQDQLTDSAKATVRKHAYPGVSITIGKNTLAVNDRTEAGSFILDDKKVCFKLS